MDRFELNWPGADASFYTDGWRCRIVWRQKGRHGGGGMGGTIDNNQQCVKRAAESLEGAPYLLSALKARGHARLADQIETVAGEEPADIVAADTASADTASADTKPQPIAAAKKPVAKVAAEQAWLQSLDGEASYEAASDKRAKAWLDLGTLGDEALLLKAPAAKHTEWVLKRTWPEDGKRKAEYVVAPSFKGVASFLIKAGAGSAQIEQMLAALAEVADPELEAAARAWRAAGLTH